MSGLGRRRDPGVTTPIADFDPAAGLQLDHKRWSSAETNGRSTMRGVTILVLTMVTGLALAQATSAQLAVKRASGGLVLEAESGAVQVGRGGSVDQRSDTDLIVYDPNGTLTEAAFHFNASLSDLRIGSGSSVDPGDDGDIRLEDGFGLLTVALDGATGLLTLGTSGQDGDLRVTDSANATGLQLDGQSGNLTNSLGGNGVVKAWARINSNGSVHSCYRCNVASSETQSTGVGSYEVDFTPLATDITSRPRSAILDRHSTGITEGQVSLADRAGDLSSVFVRTTSSDGTNLDIAFTLIIY